MYVLKADKRSPEVKVKNLRKEGIVPGCVYGGKLEETLLVQISNKEAIKLLREKTVGGQVSLEVGSKKIIGLLKEVSISPIGNKITHLSFQSLVAGEPVHSTAQIVLVNKEKVSDVIRQLLFEIPIKALPAHLVEEITIDLTGMSAGVVMRLEDLEISQNEDVEILTALDTMVLSIVEKSTLEEEPSEEEEATEATEEDAEAAEKTEE